jgi:hypothetical protein
MSTSWTYTLFSVDFDGDEVVVEQVGYLVVLEGLALHDVTPVTGGIADADEEEFVVFSSEGYGFWSPHLPCHWVVHVASYLWEGDVMLVHDHTQ